mgnify:CR=1 FL=1
MSSIFGGTDTPPSESIQVGSTTIVGGVNTRVLFDDAGLVGEDSAFTWNKTTNTLTVDNIIGSATSGSGGIVNDATFTLTKSVGEAGTYSAVSATASYTGLLSEANQILVGVNSSSFNESEVNILEVIGVTSEVGTLGIGDVTDVTCYDTSFFNSEAGSIVTNLYGLRMGSESRSPWSSVGTVTNSYGIFMDTGIDLGGTLKYAIFSSAASQSYLEGNLGIGISVPTAKLHVVQSASSSGAPKALLLAGGAHTNLTASTEAVDVNYNLARTVQFATGAKTNQRAFVVQAPTYSAVGATAITAMATFAVTGAPVAGTNVSASDTMAIWVQSGRSRFDGTIGIGSTSTVGPTLSVTQAGQTGAVQPALLLACGAHGSLTASTEYLDVNFNLSHSAQFSAGAITTQRAFLIQSPTYTATGASVFTNVATFAVNKAPTPGSNVTITNAFCSQFGGDTTQVSAAGFTYGAINIPAHTVTLTGTTQVTSAGVAGLIVNPITITDGSAITVDTAASIYVSGPPVQAGSVTLTNAYSLWVDAGSARFDGRILGAQGADVASANNLSLGTDGNAFEITGTTQINLISNVGWTNGSIVTLLFTSTPTVKNNQATSGTNIVILLNGAADFVASAGDALELMLCEIGGTQAWREIAPPTLL